MRKLCTITVVLFALSFSARAEEPKTETKKAAVVKGTVKIVGAKVAAPAPAPKAAAPAPAPASQPAKAEPVAPKADPTPALAPTPTVTQNWWQEGLTELIKLVGAILLILISTFVTVLMKKYGFEANQQVLNDVLSRAVNYVEQVTTAKLNAGAEKTPGAKKMEMAVEIAKKLAAETKLKDKGSEWWQTHLESWLGVTGTSKNGSTEKPA